MNQFTKERRLNKKSDYDHAFYVAEKIVIKNFVFFFRKNDFEFGRLGLVIPKKKISKAHDRNRLKRLIRETFRCRTLPAVDVIVLARNEVAHIPNSELLT